MNNLKQYCLSQIMIIWVWLYPSEIKYKMIKKIIFTFKLNLERDNLESI